jgi:hypothetical protein
MEQYFKITNKDEVHNGFVYKDGLNILEGRFNENTYDSCCPGGFYFTTLKFIHKYYEYGINLRIVYLPMDDLEFKMVKDPSGDKWRANRIILGEKYSLFDPKTYELFGLNIKANIYIVNFASEYGNVQFLQWWKQSGIDLDYSCSKALNDASENGHVNILEWWKHSGIMLYYNEYPIHRASYNGNYVILDWWLKSGLELKYSEYAIAWASGNGHVAVLDWWLKSGLELKYNHDAMDTASKNGHIDVLNWWLNSGLELKYSNKAIEWAKINDQDLVLAWWKNSGLEFDDSYWNKFKKTVFAYGYWTFMKIIKYNLVHTTY